MARRFTQESPRQIIVTDRDFSKAEQVANEIGATPFHLNVADAQQMQAVVDQVETDWGPIDLFCSNAGTLIHGSVQIPDADWQRVWEVNVMSHIYAARIMIPRMIARGGGTLLQTVSAAGLLMQVGAAPYTVSKHAALGLAEWLAVTYRSAGLRVFCLCPQGVQTDMLKTAQPWNVGELQESVLSTSEVAEAVVQGLEAERFLILPHPEVARYVQNRASDHERWLNGMRKLWDSRQPPSDWEGQV